MITLQGVHPHTVMGSPITDHQLKAMIKNDSILHIVQLHVVDVQAAAPDLPPEICHILQHFAALFEELTGLPPSRSRDHQIPLIPGAQPFRLRPTVTILLKKMRLRRKFQICSKQGGFSTVLLPSAHLFCL